MGRGGGGGRFMLLNMTGLFFFFNYCAAFRTSNKAALSHALTHYLAIPLYPPPHPPHPDFSVYQRVPLRPGDYAVVNVREASGHTLRGLAVARTTLLEHTIANGSSAMVAPDRGWGGGVEFRRAQQ